MSVQKIREAVQAAKGNARQIGEVVLMIAQADEHAAEVIAADLDNPEMSLQKCFDALYEHAKKNQKGGFWGCMCNRYDPDNPDNPVIQVVAEFYKIELGGAVAESEPDKPESQALTAEPEELDLMDLL